MQYYVQVFDSNNKVGDEKPRKFSECPPGSDGYFKYLPCNYGEYIPEQSLIGEPVIYPDRVEYPIMQIPEGELIRRSKIKFSEIVRIEGAKRIKLVRGIYNDVEVATWDKQEKEASAYLANTACATPLIFSIAQARGISLTTLANSIISKSEAYATAIGEVLGIQQAILDYIEASTIIIVWENTSWEQWIIAIKPPLD